MFYCRRNVKTSPTVKVAKSTINKNPSISLTSDYNHLTQEELKKLIISKTNDKKEFYNNSQIIVSLCSLYLKKYDNDLTILELIITAFCTDKKFYEALKYANIIIWNVSRKWGWFFKGEIMWYKGDIYEGSRYFSLSHSSGMDKNTINNRKRELLPFVKPKKEKRDQEQFEIEKNGIGRFILK